MKIKIFDLTAEDLMNNGDVLRILENYNLQIYGPDQVYWNETREQLLVDGWSDLKNADRDILALNIIDWDDEMPERRAILENIFELCFTDEYFTCSGCGILLKLSSSYYGDLKDHYLFECELLCRDCYTDSDILDDCLNNPHKAVNNRQLREGLDVAGFTLCNESVYESGWHPGQTDNPEKILAAAELQWPGHDFIFEIAGAGQFDISFNLWRREQ